MINGQYSVVAKINADNDEKIVSPKSGLMSSPLLDGLDNQRFCWFQ